MKILLKSLDIKNFKGFKDFQIEFKAGETVIAGDN